MVFAIAITLLVLDLKVPEIHHPTENALLNALAALIPEFVGFLLSFFLIGLYWTVHHRLFGYVIDYTPAMLWINFFFLLGIVLLPFSTSFYSKYIVSALKTPLVLYSLNFAGIGLASFAMHKYITNPKRNLTKGLPVDMAKYYSFRAIVIPIIFGLIIIVGLIDIRFAIFIPPLIPVVMYGMGKIYKSRHSVKENANDD